MQIKLSNRLAAVADLVIPGKAAADIGADHAYLAVYLVVNGICPYVIATDRVRGPLASARQLVDLLNLDKQIHVRLGEGLKTLRPKEAQTICIAGMGGYTMRSILNEAPEILESAERLVLQPQSNVPVLRRFLMENDWRIVEERIAHDNGFYYEIIAAEKGAMELNEKEIEFGPILLKEPHPLLASYLILKRADLTSLLVGLAASSGLGIEKRRQDLAFAAKRIDEILVTLPNVDKGGLKDSRNEEDKDKATRPNIVKFNNKK